MSARLTRRPMGKRGFVEAALVSDWPNIVGSMLGGATLPLRIAFPVGQRSGGTLHLRVASGAVALQIQHQEPLVIQRINSHFGYGAVSRLALTQGTIAPRPPRRSVAPPVLPPETERRLEASLSIVEDPQLREVLSRLGRHLAGRG